MCDMNTAPDTFVTVPADELQSFVANVCRRVGLPRDKADQLAGFLTGNDLRGNFSHGTRQIATYARLMKEGKLNNMPDVTVVKETQVSALVDGDGGLGYFPSHRAMEMTLRKALDVGLAVGMSRNHGHFGAAGIYARMTLGEDVLSFVTSGHQLRLKAGAPLYGAAGGSPMAFSIPCAKEPHFVLDFGTMHDLYGGNPDRDTIAELAPGLVLRSIGLGEVCQAWGGLLSGLSIDAEASSWEYAGANQGALFVVFRIDLFRDPAELKADMDEYIGAVRRMQPLPGFTESYMPGGVEAERFKTWSKDGIPMGAEHRTALEGIGRELSIDIPWLGA